MTTPNNLPAELSSFVGREPQLAELRRLLRKSRLITLTGPGGAGKTRLALRLAADQLARHPDGVWLVELAALADARLLEQTVASACGVMEKRRRPVLDVLTEELAPQKVLLVLDSCEHMVDACATLASHLLRSCSKLTILVTSREPLGVAGELIWRTPSLSVPRLEDAGHPELLLASEAVRLYVERARLSRPGFNLDAAASGALAQICARLEGMPLAIELAASLAGMMTLEETLDRLRDRFRLLTGGSRNALPRHQTLRQAVDWSYGLLSPAERALLARLAVFAGGFDLAAAEAVAPAHDGGVLQLLSRLVDKSLVVAEPGETKRTRYRLLDTIREYALEKLEHADEAESRRLHARHFLDWTRRADRELRAHFQAELLKRVDEEQANIRLALNWTIVEEPDDALRLAGATGTYWHMQRRMAEGLEWLDQALALQTPSTDGRSSALLAAARIRYRNGDYAGARRDAEECRDLSRRLGDDWEHAGALTVLGLLSGSEGEWRTAEQFHQESLEIGRQLGDHYAVARSLNNLALIASAHGNQLAARTMLEQALVEAQDSGDGFTAGAIMDSLGRVSLLLNSNSESRRYYLQSLTVSEQFENTMNLATSLEGLALLGLEEGDAERAVRMMAAARRLRAATGGQPAPDWSERVDEGLTRAREQLSPQAAEAAWLAGTALSMADAIRYASGVALAPIRADGNPLTGRETEVASLIAEGLTNGEIAKRLRMADRTADAHVEHIRNKLGLRSRSQIAVWAHERLGTA